MPKLFENFIFNALKESKIIQSSINFKNFKQNKRLYFDEDEDIEIIPG